MLSNQLPGCHRALRLAVSLSLTWGLASCALFEPRTKPVEAAPVTAPADESPAESSADGLTATEAATDIADDEAAGSTTVIGDATGMLSPTAPRDYVVRRGDTLWAIASMFLRDPWLWPEIWYVNPQVRNPHRIYPGDTLHLAYGTDGRPRITLERGSAARLHPQLRSTDNLSPIQSIPYDSIASFLSKPTLLSADEVAGAPYVLALVDDHLVAGNSNELYVKKLNAGVGERFLVIHVEDPLKDPETGDKLGYLGAYAGTVQVVRAGATAKVVVVDSGREIVSGDVLIPDTSTASLTLIPRVPQQDVHGRIIAVVDSVLMVGQFEVVALNKGSTQGLAPGHILSTELIGAEVKDRCASINNVSTCKVPRSVKLPDEVSGTMMVFKTFDRMSYALILNEQYPIVVGDGFHKP